MEDSSQSQHSEASPQHTPGPWHFEYLTVFRLTNEGPEFIAEVESGLAADVDLIAAAPDLLAALKEAWRFAERQRAKWPQDFWPEWWRLAGPAIAKAEGREAE